jgi:S1-C subfamily serine protease
MQRSGLKREDIIIEANGQKIRDSSDWEDLTHLALFVTDAPSVA